MFVHYMSSYQKEHIFHVYKDLHPLFHIPYHLPMDIVKHRQTCSHSGTYTTNVQTTQMCATLNNELQMIAKISRFYLSIQHLYKQSFSLLLRFVHPSILYPLIHCAINVPFQQISCFLYKCVQHLDYCYFENFKSSTCYSLIFQNHKHGENIHICKAFFLIFGVLNCFRTKAFIIKIVSH